MASSKYSEVILHSEYQKKEAKKAATDAKKNIKSLKKKTSKETASTSIFPPPLPLVASAQPLVAVDMEEELFPSLKQSQKRGI